MFYKILTFVTLFASFDALNPWKRSLSCPSNKRPKDGQVFANAPPPLGPFSHVVKVSPTAKTVYISAQSPRDPRTGNLETYTMEEQSEQVIENLALIARESGGCLSQIVKLNVFLATDKLGRMNYDNLKIMNQVMDKYFLKPHPARSTIGVAALPVKDALIEVEAIMEIP